jgi:hypothetical protein
MHLICFLVLLFTPLFLCPMEGAFLLTSVGSDKYLNTIERKVSSYFDQTLPIVKLSELNNKYCALPNEVKPKFICRMSSELRLLHSIALAFPQEVQKHIYGAMLNGNSEETGVEFFYNGQSVLDSFETYRHIIKEIGLHKPIAPLYLLKKEELPKILNNIRRFDDSYFGVVISEEEQKELQKMIPDVQNYFAHYNAHVLSRADMKNYKSAMGMAIQCLLMTMLSGSTVPSGIIGTFSFGMFATTLLVTAHHACMLRYNSWRKVIEC